MANPRRRPSHYRRKAEGDTPAQTQVIKHGMYTSPNTMDGRSWLARSLKRIRNGLLEGFPDPAPFRVQTLADLCSVKIFRINAYQAGVLSGTIEPNDKSEDQCLAYMNSATRDLIALEQLAARLAPAKRVPSLQEYLEELKKGNILPAEGEAV
jgi:hypothetical protein